MFPSDNNSNHENPLEPLLHKKPSLFQLSDHNQNPTIPKQDDGHHDPPFFTDFPSPFFDGHELPFNQILPRRDPPTPPVKPVDPTQTNPALSKKMGEAKRGLKLPKPKERPGTDQPPRRQNLGVVSRKRAGKKDRHSKICTAQGVRDRRMRLSLQVARKFFDLQDMLGYDKASSTIEWLFSKSKRAIRELVTKAREDSNFSFSAGDWKTESFLSECEAASGIHEASPKNGDEPRIAGWRARNVRESREKARARARWRTREKNMIRSLEDSGQYWANFSANPNYQNDSPEKLGFLNSPLGGVIDHDVGTIENLLGSSRLSTSNICGSISDNYNYRCCIDPNSSFMGLIGNWEVSSQFTVTDQGSSEAGSVNYSGGSLIFPLLHH